MIPKKPTNTAPHLLQPIFSFRKFEDSSLNYVGGTKRTEIYGGFEDSKISREELKDF